MEEGRRREGVKGEKGAGWDWRYKRNGCMGCKN